MEMKLEFLPNEIILVIFGYINDIELLGLFSNLNARFNDVLSHRWKNYRLNFQSMNKKDVDLICRRSLPNIIDQIVALHLSDDDDTPYQIEQFFSYRFSLRQMTHLVRLSLYQLRSSYVLNDILSQLSRLRHLISLKIDQIHFGMEETDQFIRIIWSLPNLTHFHIAGTNFRPYCCLPELTIYSSFKQLYMLDSYFTLEQLAHLLECTLYLVDLSITIFQNSTRHELIFDPFLNNLSPSLTVLNIAFGYLQSLDELKYLFLMMPNLHELKIKIYDSRQIINGNDWEQIICDYLSKLKVFHLHMSFSVDRYQNVKEYVDRLLNSFRTPFWLHKRQLYFRCQWQQDTNEHHSVSLYTLPYSFPTFDYNKLIDSQTTCLDQSGYWLYNRVDHLSVTPATEKLDIARFPVRFLNVRHLDIGYDITSIETICPLVLDQLITLHIYSMNNRYQSHLQALLDRAPRLQTIIFEGCHLDLLFATNQTVRRLIFNEQKYNDVQECVKLSKSKLFHQCEVLQINLSTHVSVLDLLRKGLNLRTLIFKCRSNQSKKDQISSASCLESDEIVKWLKHRLPLGYWIQRENDGQIRVWTC